jgi:dihydrofolate synthase/folylpolyglutamate synthase
LARERDWYVEPTRNGMLFEDAGGRLKLPAPSLPGLHQIDNAGVALAALRASALPVPDAALARGLAHAEWPARLQRLTGHLAKTLPANWELWLDGGHNAGAGEMLGQHVRMWSDRHLHIIVGMKRSKDAEGFLRPLLSHATTVWAVAEPGQYFAQSVEEIVAASGGLARPGPTVARALAALPRAAAPARVLICGSLYLAGEVLKLDGS